MHVGRNCIMHILVRSQKEAEEIKVNDEWHGFISITDPGAEPVKLNQTKATILTIRLSFDDSTTQESWVKHGYKEMYNRDAVLFSEHQAIVIFNHLLPLMKKLDLLIVHCHA